MGNKVINLNDYLMQQAPAIDPANYTKNTSQVAWPVAGLNTPPACAPAPPKPQAVAVRAARVPKGWAVGSLLAWWWCAATVAFAWWWGGKSSITALQQMGLPVDPDNVLSNLWWAWQVGLSLFEFRVIKNLDLFSKGGWDRLIYALKYDKALMLLGFILLAWDSGTTDTGFSDWANGKSIPFGPLKMQFDMTQPASIVFISILSIIIASFCEPLIWKIWGKIKESWQMVVK
jgi:hypothetical protein